MEVVELTYHRPTHTGPAGSEVSRIFDCDKAQLREVRAGRAGGALFVACRHGYDSARLGDLTNWGRRQPTAIIAASSSPIFAQGIY